MGQLPLKQGLKQLIFSLWNTDFSNCIPIHYNKVFTNEVCAFMHFSLSLQRSNQNIIDMPRKVLISFLGTGSFDKKMLESREYKTANYHLEDKNLGDYPFVAAAIRPKPILPPTLHS